MDWLHLRLELGLLLKFVLEVEEVDVERVLAARECSVEVEWAIAVGVLAGRGVPQADKIKARTIANLASEIFFICRSLLATLIVARMGLKKQGPDPGHWSIYAMVAIQIPENILFILQIGIEHRHFIFVSEVKEYQSKMKQA